MNQTSHARDRCVVVIDGDDEVMQDHPTGMTYQGALISIAG
jgi:hypothetical protein